MQVRSHTFRAADLVGGHVVLDLVNTVTARDADPIDWLDSYQRVLEWAALTEAFDPAALAQVERMSLSEPDAAERALRRLRELRELIHDLLTATVRNEPVSEEKLRVLEGRWKTAVAHARLGLSGRHTTLEVGVEPSGLHYLEHELALRAFDLLQSLPVARTRICAGTRCGWVFIDRSKAGRRRWCDMATCGNAEKSRRHYERKRAASRR